MWPWLDPRLSALSTTLSTSGFVDDVTFHSMRPMVQMKHDVNFFSIEFTRRRQQSDVRQLFGWYHQNATPWVKSAIYDFLICSWYSSGCSQIGRLVYWCSSYLSPQSHISPCLSGGKRGDYQNCSVLYCVRQLYTIISTLWWAVLAVLRIGFWVHFTVHCLDLFVFICVYFVLLFFILHICCVIVSTVGWT